MKYSFLMLILLVTLFSCSKGWNNSPALANGTFQFRVNDTLVTIDNSNVIEAYVTFFKQVQENIVPSRRYTLIHRKGLTTFRHLQSSQVASLKAYNAFIKRKLEKD